ncbi:MAG TPA: hypothetical protein VNC78_00020 [Actinomycetota bacterium]|nr:hypothetical protein [Actinomycetota bacterium]
MKLTRLVGVAMAALLLAVPAWAGPSQGPDDLHSDNIKELARSTIRTAEGNNAAGSDMAFQKDLLVAGSYQGTGFFKILKGAPYIKQIGFHPCPGSQGDVSVYKDLVFVSLNGPQSEGSCLDPGGHLSDGKAGVRILDISKPAAPVQVGFVETDCGSHTHVINPIGDTVYVYVMSYPLGVPSDTCNPVSHRKVSIIEVPVGAPQDAAVTGFLDVSPEIGCHDVTIFPGGEYAAAACIGESQIWDMSDPAMPSIVSRIVNPLISIHHGTGVTWDGKYLAIADEFAGSVTGECLGHQRSPMGALWFYDISDPTLPVLAGYYNSPRRGDPQSADEVQYIACTSHNFNILPTKEEGRYLAAVAYRAAGMSIVDFSDPMNPVELAYYHQLDEGLIPDLWAAYWYNGRVYTNDNGANRGLSVYELGGTTSPADMWFFKDRMNPQVQDAALR